MYGTRLFVPKYRKHKASGQAVVTLSGRDFYLGPYGSKISRLEYDRLTGEWLAAGRRLPPSLSGQAGPVDLTVLELAAAYWDHIDTYYRTPEGEPGKEVEAFKVALRPLLRLYGDKPAAEIGPLALKAIQQALAGSGLSRKTVNEYCWRVKKLFKWAVSQELIPAAVHQGLSTVEGLRRGRSTARETEPVRPVAAALVEAVKPHVAAQVWAMVELQRLTGMRSGEVVIMRTGDLDTTGQLWIYRPGHHKTAHHGHKRIVYLGPKAQEVLKPYLKPDLAAYLFQPLEAEEARLADCRRRRRTKLWPSHVRHLEKKRARRPRRTIGVRYTSDSYRRAIERGIEAAYPLPAEILKLEDQEARRQAAAVWHKDHHWHPHQLRHSFATEIRKQYGLDAARALLGHRSAAITEVYAELDHAKAGEIMGKIG